MNITASNAGLWVNCNGSALMQALLPADSNGEETEKQKEGRAYSEVVTDMLKALQDPEQSMPTMSTLIGSVTTNGVAIDSQMAQASVDFTTNIMKYLNQNGLMRKMVVAEKLDTPMLGEGKYGVPDVLVYDDKNAELFIAVAKYGHRSVEAFENYQLIIYALSYLDSIGIDGIADQHVKVRLRVYQPRSHHPDGACHEWLTMASDLRGYRNHINHAVAASMGNDAKCVPGSWCYGNRCSAAAGCTSLQSSVYNHIDFVDTLTPTVMNETDAAAEYLILVDAEERIKTRRKALEQQCLHMVQNGQNVPGLAASQGYGRERWCKGVKTDEIIMMGDLMGVDLRKPAELETPAQCRKLGVDDAVIKAYSETPKTSVKLVKDDGRKARQVFR